MFSGTGKPVIHSAAWRISMWGSLGFACGTLIIFAFLHRFVSQDIQLRSDAWLSGEVEVLGDVAERTPKDTLYSRVVSEIAELASKEVPDKQRSNDALNDSVFFLLTGPDNSLGLWVGEGNGQDYLKAIRSSRILPGFPSDLHVAGFQTPFRVVSDHLDNGSIIYLGLSERDELRVLRNLRLLFLLLGLLIVLFGSAIVFYTTRRMLGHVRKITDAASRIGESDLSSRVPTTNRHDEVGQLAFTLNRMLDRIQSSVHQLHTITDSLAHDLRSPLTAIRAKLEMSLTSGASVQDFESIVSAIEEIDRITDFLNKSLDVAEANADALRLERVTLDVDEVLQVMMDLYEPCMAERGLRIRFNSGGTTRISADAALIHRTIANLFDNELKHLPAASTVTISVRSRETMAVLLLEDDGPGFPAEIAEHLFERSVRGPSSRGHGMGLAFVEAVVRAHNGSIEASNRVEGGARITITFPLVDVVPAEGETSELALEHRH
jgi:signal transduction histidine kinase